MSLLRCTELQNCTGETLFFVNPYNKIKQEYYATNSAIKIYYLHFYMICKSANSII